MGSSNTVNDQLIQPRTLRGFRDFLPESMIPREALMETARTVYRSFGYSPIDTPALEYLEILRGKGSEETDRQMYQFTDHGNREVGLRFDLTVPLARFVAQHIDQLGTPFKRYHIATVWRGEKSQAGRYREFVQCDFDTIGTTSIASDAETALVIHELLQAIGFDNFVVHINNRKVLNGLLQKFDLVDCAADVLRALDKSDKLGRDRVAAELGALGTSDQQVDEILQLTALSGTNAEILAQLAELVQGNELAESGLDELVQVHALTQAAGIADARVKIDPSIARGLDYYTGIVFETFLGELPSIGSVCSGGRYDNLAGLYTTRQLPGIGASLGLDRLLAAMQQLGMLKPANTPCQVMIAFFDNDRLADYLRMAAAIRGAGLAVEVYTDCRKLGQQLKYADRRGFSAALVAGSKEFAEKTVQIKWLAENLQEECAVHDGWERLTTRLLEKLKTSEDERRVNPVK